MRVQISKQYPKQVRLRDGRTATLRPMNRGDEEQLLAFFAGLPLEDRQYLRDNVADPAVVATWVRRLDFERVIPILAEIDDRIVADGTLHMAPHSWSRHVGEIRLVVDREFQHLGLGLALAKEIFFLAVQLKLEKIVAEVAADQAGALNVFESLGFRREALLKDHVIDLKGRKIDLVIMSNHVSSLWDKIHDHILESVKDFSGG